MDESLRLLDIVRATCISPSYYTLSIMVELFGYARRLNRAFQCIEGRRGCVSASCSKYPRKELFPDFSAEFEMKGSEVK